MLTRRGRLVVALGVAVYVTAWAFGAEALYPVAVGLLLAALLAWAWVRVLHRPMELHRTTWPDEHVEGEDVALDLLVRHEGRVRPSALRVIQRIGRLGAHEVPLRPARRGLAGRRTLRAVPRGRYRFEEAVAVLEDPFGLARIDVRLPTRGALLVLPRVADLQSLFSEAGAHARDGRRLLLRRPTGFDLHSVRDYERGESLRKVHWRSTAHRGRLMVKELEDAPRDEVAVVLDATAGAIAGTAPDSSFDVQVRAAASILRAHARRGRRAVLVVNSRERESQRLRADAGDWQRALELLAAAEPTGTTPVAALLAEGSGAVGSALDVAVVTALLTRGLADRLAQRVAARRPASVVYVDRASFAGARADDEERRLLLRLGALGVPVAVLRRGDDLAAVLSRSAAAATARRAAS